MPVPRPVEPDGPARATRGAEASLHPNATPWKSDHEPTDFQRAVVRAAQALGPGDLVTYGDLAQEVGRPGSAQAVANVLRSAPGVPWWRVLPSDGRLYRSHAPVQAALLRAEGHDIDEHRRVHPNG
jgi:methylated-DNA-protein-cysteine methyltransferase related protein